MKNFKSIALALVVVLSTLSVTAQTKKVDAANSSINWVGKKVTGQHNGTVNLKSGTIVFKGKKLTGGTFVVDMTSLTATDLQGEWQGTGSPGMMLVGRRGQLFYWSPFDNSHLLISPYHIHDMLF